MSASGAGVFNPDLKTKENHHVPSKKRLYEAKHQLPAKRFKIEDDDSSGEPSEAQLPIIPSNGSTSTRQTYGVKRIAPCPPECRPSHRDFALYREQLVKKVIDDLAREGKSVQGQVRFL